MNVWDFNRSRMVRDSFHTTTWGVIVAIVAVSIVVAAIFAYMNSKGNDTSGDDTRAVVNDEPISADINTHNPDRSRHFAHAVTRHSVAAAVVRGVVFSLKKQA